MPFDYLNWEGVGEGVERGGVQRSLIHKSLSYIYTVCSQSPKTFPVIFITLHLLPADILLAQTITTHNLAFALTLVTFKDF